MLRPLARDARAARLPAPRLHAHHERARALPRALCARRRCAQSSCRSPTTSARGSTRCGRAVAHAEKPLYGRLDAVCDFTSARWQDSLQFMEPNLSGVGGIHLGPLAETLVMRDVVPTLQGYDPQLAIDAAARSARSVPAGAARSRARDRQPRHEPRARRAEVRRRRARRAIASRRVLPRAARHRARARRSARAAARRRRRLLRGRAHRRRLSRLRDPRPAGARAAKHGRRLDAIRALFLQNRMVSAIGGDLDHKSCWEVLTSDELASRYFSIAERQLFRRHVLWTRVVSERAHRYAGRADGLARVHPRLPRGARAEAEPRLRRHGRAPRRGVVAGRMGSAARRGARAAQHDPHRQWVVQAAATLPVHLFPVLDEQGRTHEEPFYAVMGFAPTDHGLGHHRARLAEASRQRRAARRSRGRARRLPARGFEELDALARAAGSRVARAARDGAASSAISTPSIHLLEWDEETYRPRGAAEDRASQLAVLGALRHELLAGDRLGDLLGRARGARKISRARERVEIERLGAAAAGCRRVARRVSSRRSPKRARIASRHGSRRGATTTTPCS